MKIDRTLRERCFFSEVETLLAVILSWLTPYPWYADVGIALLIDIACLAVAKSALWDLENDK